MNEPSSSPEALAAPGLETLLPLLEAEVRPGPLPFAIANIARGILLPPLLKAGYATTEFWIVGLVVVALIAQGSLGRLSPDLAAQLTSLIAILWMLIRSLLKSLAARKLSSSLNGAQGDPATASVVCAHETKVEATPQ